MNDVNTYREYLKAHRDRFVEELMTFLRIPSVSALNEHAGDVAEAGRWTARRLEKAGLENVNIMPTGGHPVVYGDWLHAGDKPTVMIYGHFDTQPADPFDLWETPPFDPALRDDRIYARGASDDKGNLLAPITAIEALLATEGGLPVNVKFFAEGQEEIGSPQLPAFVHEHRSLLACDLVLSADGLQWSPDQPKIDVGFRGVVAFEINLFGPESDLHSGLFGGVVGNPNHALARILASFHDADGRVAVKGFYDDVIAQTDEERRRMAAIPFDEATLKTSLGVNALFGEAGYTPLEREWTRPTLEICGMGGGFQGEGVKNIVPAKAMAKISCRLTADQDPDRIMKMIRQHIEALALPGVRVEIMPEKGAVGPYLMPGDHPGVKAAADVLTALYGKAPYLTRCGGTIPVCSLFLKELGVYTVSFGFSHGDENLHGPNEFFRLESLDRSQSGYLMLLHALAEMM